MPELDAGNVVQLTMVGHLHGQTILNVFNYRIAVSVEPPDEAAAVYAQMAGVFFANTHAKIMGRTSNEYSADHLRIQGVYPTRYVHHTFTSGISTNEGGQDAGNALPTSVAVVTSLTSELAGASHRGRKYWAGLPVTNEDDSAVEEVVLGAWRSVVDADLIQDLEVNVGTSQYIFVPIIWSMSNPTNKDDIKGALTQRVLRTQRRRQLGRGI